MGRPRARVICNPSSGGGAYDPDELRAELDGSEAAAALVLGSPRARGLSPPSAGGGAYDPDELRAEFDGYELDWVQTEGPGDASEAAREWPEGRLIRGGGGAPPH